MIYRYHADRGGWRFVVLFHHGYKHIRLFDTATFDIYTVSPREAERLKPYVAVPPKTLARRIRQRRRILKRCGIGFPKKTVEKVLAALRA